MAEEKVPQKVVMIVNGQPIEVCLKTLIISNQRAQNVLKTIKKESMQGMHTLRFFWGDVMMLNIITNHLLQKIDSKSLARMLKPVNSLEEDWKEYYDEHVRKTETLKNAIITAFDSSLPLDYSSELEKYYKDEYLDKDKKENEEFENVVKETNQNSTQTSENTSSKENGQKAPQKEPQKEKKDAEISKKPSKEISESSKISDKKFKKTQKNNNFTDNEKIQKRASYKPDTDEENIDFTSLFGGFATDDEPQNTEPIENFISLENKNNLFTNETAPNQTNEVKNPKDEFTASKEAFTNFNSIDLDKLFE